MHTSTLPHSKHFEFYGLDTSQGAEGAVFPLVKGISCGFPSPAEDYLDDVISLDQIVIRDRTATFFGRARGDSMIDANIHKGDVVVIDKSLKPKNGDICLCQVDGEFTVKQLRMNPGYVELVPANAAYAPLRIRPEQDFEIWGVVTYVIHKTRT
jgi:DNA polymerase V